MPHARVDLTTFLVKFMPALRPGGVIDTVIDCFIDRFDLFYCYRPGLITAVFLPDWSKLLNYGY